MGQQSHFDRVRGLVSGQSGVPESEITMETRLLEDLGMDGDDGDEFLEAFADEFGVDMSRMAPFNYFNDEPPALGYSSLIPLIEYFDPQFRAYVRHSTRGERTLTVRNLVASARAKRWITPVQRREECDPTEFPVFCALWLTFFVAFPAYVGHLGYMRGEPLIFVVPAVVWGIFALNFLRSLSMLRRHDAAATFEEQALNPKVGPGISAKD